MSLNRDEPTKLSHTHEEVLKLEAEIARLKAEVIKQGLLGKKADELRHHKS